MILPDVNLLVYAYNKGAPQHDKAKSWLESVFNGREEVGLAWVALMGFVRLLSHPKVVTVPTRPEILWETVQGWLQLSVCRTIGPGSDHCKTMAKLFRESGAGAQLVTDIHLASLAIEYKAVLYSNDTDFLRFPGLKVKNPLG